MERLKEVKMSNPPSLIETEVFSLLFADDIALLSNSIAGLQRMLGFLNNYCNEWDLNVNIGKSEIVVFKKGTKLKTQERWSYDGSRLEIVNSFKYLGINFSYNGKWAKHIRITITKAKYAVMQLCKFARKYEDCEVKLILRLFDAIVVPVMLYGSELYMHGKKGYGDMMQ